MIMEFAILQENNGIFMLPFGLIKLLLIHHSELELVHTIQNATQTIELKLILNQVVINFFGITEL